MTPIITQEFMEQYRDKQPQWGFNGLGYIVYKRTYARLLEHRTDGTTEEWYQTVARCINGAQKLGADYTQQEAERLYDYIFYLKGNFAGRMLWQLGTSTVDRFGANSLLNCWFVSIKDVNDFCFLFENLMLGGGVGFSVKREDVYHLPKVLKNVTVTHQNTNDADFIVPDSREGWVKLLRNVLDAYLTAGKSFTYSTVLVRGAGERISGFGGTASGSPILISGIEKICTVLKQREGKKLRSLDVLDICNIIGSIVVAGNVRRSAEIALGDPDDFLFARAKRWDLGSIPNWRSMSNNTIYADSFEQISDAIWTGYEGNGEPYGFFNLPLSQKMGRLGEPRSDNCEGTNPCVTGDMLVEVYFPETETTANITVEDAVWMFERGDNMMIRSHSFVGDQDDFSPVLFAGKTRENAPILKITDEETGNSIRVTEDHLVYTINRGYVLAKDLQPTDQLKFVDSTQSNGPLDINQDGHADVYDFTVRNDSNFYANNTLVHNCGEISLSDKECCNLSELYLNNIESVEELCDIAKLLYKTQKAICAMPFIHDETNAIVHKNMRIGLGVTGVCQSEHKLEWLDQCYRELRQFDKEWSKVKGWPESIKLTTIKPSGCTSLDTRIRTSRGVLSMSELFALNGITREETESLVEGTWIEPKVDITVKDMNNEDQKVTKLYYNGVKPVYEIEFEDGNIYQFTGNHRLLTVGGEWKRVDELSEQDEIVGFGTNHPMLKIAKIRKAEQQIHTVDIEVAGTHSYQLDNGAVSHNTLSIVAGATPGVHPGFSQYHIRRIRMSSNDMLVKMCRELGYEIEYLKNFDGTEDHGTVIVSFPCEFDAGTRFANEMKAVEQLELVKKMQTVWADNSISVTVYYRREELEDIKAWLKKNYKKGVKSVSFLLHSDHGFAQAPYEEIDQARYRQLSKKLKPISSNHTHIDQGTLEDLECGSGACPIK